MGPDVIQLERPTRLVQATDPTSEMVMDLQGPGEYCFRVSDTGSGPSLRVNPRLAPIPNKMYVRGAFNNNGTTDELVFEGFRYYKGFLPVETPQLEFKVTDQDFSPEYTYAIDPSNPAPISYFEQTYLQAVAQASSDIIMTDFLPGMYEFELDAGNILSPRLAVYEVSFYVRGTFNDFGTGNFMYRINDSTIETISVVAPGAHEFTITDYGSSDGVTYSVESGQPGRGAFQSEYDAADRTGHQQSHVAEQCHRRRHHRAFPARHDRPARPDIAARTDLNLRRRRAQRRLMPMTRTLPVSGSAATCSSTGDSRSSLR